MAEVVLAVPVMSQEQRLWCWAAIASGVCRFLNGTLSQCAVAERVLGPGCCANPPGCNTPVDLAVALERAGVRCSPLNRQLEPGELAERIVGHRRPVGIRVVHREDFTEHFVLVTGCDPEAGTVVVTDPWGERSAAAPRYGGPFEMLGNYGGWGAWTHSFVIE